jgi:formate/nitrite transporter
MAGGKAMSLVFGPAAGYAAIVDKGEQLCKASLVQIFALSTFAGCFIGFGALLSLTIGGRILPAVEAYGSGVQTWTYAALFPVNLLFILLSGSILFTGATFTTPSAVIEGRATILRSFLVIFVAWIGNLVGGWGFAIFTDLCGLNEDAVAVYVVKVAVSKTTKGWGKIFLRGIGCNWLVCMAVFLCTLAQDMTGKYVGIFFPISTFVACGFEHYPANAYALPLATLALNKEKYKVPDAPNFGNMLWENLIPASLGNLFAGVVIMSMGFSFFFGGLKTGQCLKKKQEAPEAPQQPPEQEMPKLTAVADWQKDSAAAANVQPQADWRDSIAGNNEGFARTVSC